MEHILNIIAQSHMSDAVGCNQGNQGPLKTQAIPGITEKVSGGIGQLL